MTLDFTNYKFRASSLGKIMTGVDYGLTDNQAKQLSELKAKQEAGKITDKQLVTLGKLIEKRDAKPELSSTVKTYLQQLHKEEVFGKKKEIRSKYLDKGIQCEELSISLYSSVTGQFIVNNKTRKENDFLTGECDNSQKIIREFKSSWELETFPMYETEIPNNDYWWQCQAYMEIWNMDKSELIYCLVDTPDGLVIREIYSMENRLGYSETGLPQKFEDEIRNNMSFEDIPEELRVKIFPIERDSDSMRKSEHQIELCREYLNELSIGIGDKLNTTNQN